MALIRYPGSKEKLVKQILSRCPAAMLLPLWADAMGWEYREPFFGCGAIGFKILQALPLRSRVWLNDIDYWLICLWQTVLRAPQELCEKVHAFSPTLEAFYAWKESDGAKDIDPVEAGFRKLALHQMSYSGLGAMSGGPLGGKDQENAKYRVDCRWKPERLQTKIWELHSILSRFPHLRFTCTSYELLFNYVPKQAFIYLDPPYVDKGSVLYKHAMDEASHRTLASIARQIPCAWVLSYDDAPLVRELYEPWATIEPVHCTYTVGFARSERPKNQEILIYKSTERQQ